MRKDVFIMMNRMKISVKKEKTDFGNVWYISSNPKGIFRFAIYRYDDDKKTIYLSNVFVDKEHRKEGIGNAILNAADKIAKKMNADSICLKVKRDSFVYEWYKRYGYSDLCVDDEDKEFMWMVKRFKGGSN